MLFVGCDAEFRLSIDKPLGEKQGVVVHQQRIGLIDKLFKLRKIPVTRKLPVFL